MTGDWVPGADAPVLAQRARLLRTVRQFFDGRGLLEVTTPVLGATGVSDVHIENLVVPVDGEPRFLQTSPEYFMKRLLAAGSGPIYQIGPAFRGHESGARHNAEFTLLEWYRPGFEFGDLIDELEALLTVLFAEFDCDAGAIRKVRYKDLFTERFGENPHAASLPVLARLAREFATDHIEGPDDMGKRNDYLDLLFAAGIEAALNEPVIVREYPASQAALACTGEDADGDPVSYRFECLWRGVELANGYFELRDPVELQRRMSENNRLRRSRGLPTVEPDRKLLAALPLMPACSGVAVGVDRLLMLLVGKQTLDEVLSFSGSRL